MARDYRQREERDSELIDKLVHINRVAKVVKGGRRFGFAALVVVGDQRGRVGFGKGKAREVPEAIRKATEAAKRSMIRVPLKDGRTLHHETKGHHGAGKVVVRPAEQGTGIGTRGSVQSTGGRFGPRRQQHRIRLSPVGSTLRALGGSRVGSVDQQRTPWQSSFRRKRSNG